MALAVAPNVVAHLQRCCVPLFESCFVSYRLDLALTREKFILPIFYVGLQKLIIYE